MSKERPVSSAVLSHNGKRIDANIGDKINILNWYHLNGEKQVSTISHFADNGFPNLRQPVLSKWLKKEQELRAKVAEGVDTSVKTIRNVSNPDFETAMSLWVDQMEEGTFNGLSGEAIKQVAILFYDKLNVPAEERLQLSEGWLYKFKQRQKLKLVHFHGEAASATAEAVKAERSRIAALITTFCEEGYSFNDIYNMDETALFYAATPDQGLAREARSGKKQSKTRITIALTVNATGSHRLDPFLLAQPNVRIAFRKSHTPH